MGRGDHDRAAESGEGEQCDRGQFDGEGETSILVSCSRLYLNQYRSGVGRYGEVRGLGMRCGRNL